MNELMILEEGECRVLAKFTAELGESLEPQVSQMPSQVTRAFLVMSPGVADSMVNPHRCNSITSDAA